MRAETKYTASDKRVGFTVRDLQALSKALYDAQTPADAELRVFTGFGPKGLLDVRLVAVEVIPR